MAGLIVDGLFAIPASTPLSAAGAVLCGLVDDAIGLPSPSGDNSVEFSWSEIVRFPIAPLLDL